MNQRMDAVVRTIVFLLYMCTVLIWHNNGECIQSVPSSNSSEMDILNNMNGSTCLSVNGKSEETKPVIKKLQVNKTCVHGTHVNVMVFLSGRQDCRTQEILFVNHETPDCSMEIRCQSEKGIPYSSNDTMCLLKCPKIETYEETYGIDLISGYQTQNLCGLQIYQVEWIAPNGWSGPYPVLYRSFDTPDQLTLMEGTQEKNFAPLVSGKINSAVSTDRLKKQWIDLGIHTEACMTRPETCGAAGGAVSMWLNLDYQCHLHAGILTTRLYFATPRKFFQTITAPPSGWTHVVINYIGPENGQGIMTYYDGVQNGTAPSGYRTYKNTGDGHIIIGRTGTYRDEHYASVRLDELMFFNVKLTESEIIMLSQF